MDVAKAEAGRLVIVSSRNTVASHFELPKPPRKRVNLYRLKLVQAVSAVLGGGGVNIRAPKAALTVGCLGFEMPRSVTHE